MNGIINSLGSFIIRVFSDGTPKSGYELSRKTLELSKDSTCYYFLPYKQNQELLLGLKRGDDMKLAEIRAPLLVALKDIRGEIAGNPETCRIVPLPQSRLRVLRRGFNQTRRLLYETLARDREKLFIFETGNLVKVRETKKQALLSRAERLRAQKGAFALRHPERLKGTPVILFDDIVTTGATLLEARRTLKKAGVRDVICVALAH